MSVAAKRGQADMTCPAAVGQVLSKKMIGMTNDVPAYAGVERAEYTIGVSGCGKETKYLVACPNDRTGSVCHVAESH